MNGTHIFLLTVYLCVAAVFLYYLLLRPIFRLIRLPKDRTYRVQIIEWGICFIILSVATLFTGLTFLFQAPAVTFFGWTAGLVRIAGGFAIEPVALLVGLGAAALFFVFLHFSIRVFASAWRFRKTLGVGAVCFGVAICGMALMCAVHEIWWLSTKKMVWIGTSLREAAYRMKSINNLKQMALGVHEYHDQYHALPNGAAVRADGSLGPSWATLILPFIEHEDIYASIQPEESWRSEANRAAYTQEPVNYFADPSLRRQNLPSHDADGYALCDYAANERVLAAGSVMTLDEITDGASNTLLFGEVRENRRPWGDPVNARDPFLGINRHRLGFGPYHPGGADFALCDASVRFLSEKIDPKILNALATPNGGEPAEL